MAVTSRTNDSGYGRGRVCGKAVFSSTSDPKYDHVAPIMCVLYDHRLSTENISSSSIHSFFELISSLTNE